MRRFDGPKCLSVPYLLATTMAKKKVLAVSSDDDDSFEDENVPATQKWWDALGSQARKPLPIARSPKKVKVNSSESEADSDAHEEALKGFRVCSHGLFWLEVSC